MTRYTIRLVPGQDLTLSPGFLDQYGNKTKNQDGSVTYANKDGGTITIGGIEEGKNFREQSSATTKLKVGVTGIVPTGTRVSPVALLGPTVSVGNVNTPPFISPHSHHAVAVKPGEFWGQATLGVDPVSGNVGLSGTFATNNGGTNTTGRLLTNENEFVLAARVDLINGKRVRTHVGLPSDNPATVGMDYNDNKSGLDIRLETNPNGVTGGVSIGQRLADNGFGSNKNLQSNLQGAVQISSIPGRSNIQIGAINPDSYVIASLNDQNVLSFNAAQRFDEGYQPPRSTNGIDPDALTGIGSGTSLHLVGSVNLNNGVTAASLIGTKGWDGGSVVATAGVNGNGEVTGSIKGAVRIIDNPNPGDLGDVYAQAGIGLDNKGEINPVLGVGVVVGQNTILNISTDGSDTSVKTTFSF